MAVNATMVSVEEYLNTSYSDGDREYVDGVVMERNLGEKDHSKIQHRIDFWFGQLAETQKVFVFPEIRVQVKSTRYRVPDVCIYLDHEPDEQVFQTPPFLVVEVLSKDDRASDIQEKVDEYLVFGVPFVWVIDPRRKTAIIHTPSGAANVNDGILRTANPTFELALAWLFR